MPFSRSFRALFRLTALWSIPWIAGGLAVGTLRWILSIELQKGPTTFGTWLLNHAVSFGSLGLISGLWLGLLLARLADRSDWTTIPRPRVALGGALAGSCPILLFAALGLLFGAPAPALWALAPLGILSAAASAVLATSAHAAATAQLPEPVPPPQLST